MTLTKSTPAWTFADQASSYRFWALIIAAVSVMIGSMAMRAYLTWLFRSSDAFLGRQTALGVYLWMAGNLVGLLVGLLLTQSKSARGYFLVPLMAGALALVIATLGPTNDVSLPCIAFFCGQAAMMTLAVAVPSALAGGTCNRASFGCAFALLSLLQMASNSYSGYGMTALVQTYGGRSAAIAACIAMLLAALLLVPLVGQRLDVAPKQRHRPLPPKRRSGRKVGLLALLPWVALAVVAGVAFTSSIRVSGISTLFLLAATMTAVGVVYSAYWFYRIHGEVACLVPSQHLFTPWAALWMYLLVPLAGPLLLLTLGRTLRETAAEAGMPVQSSSAWFNFWSVIMPPIAMGLVQGQLNEVVRRYPREK